MAFASHHEFFRAMKAADKARRRGDHKDCAHWLKIANAHLSLAERMAKLDMIDQKASHLEASQQILLEDIEDMRRVNALKRVVDDTPMPPD